ncbi:MAG: hypothetical protein SFU86_14050 [Pirellulaceae bacterium]|nr:hypothetical protein [Pirellulaceae bacterium]
MQWINHLLKSHFFKPQGAESLSLFRLLYCATLCWRIFSDGHYHLEQFSNPSWHPIPLFELFRIPLMSRELFQVLHFVLVASLALTALGAFTRISATIAWITFFFYMGTELGFSKAPHSNYVYHSQNIIVFILFLLSVAPDVARFGFDGWRGRGWRWSVDPSERLTSAWPTQLVKLMLGLAYFGSFYCKMVAHPLWADGYTLQAYLLSKHLVVDSPLAAWIAQHWWLCLTLGLATLVLEGTFFLVVFFPRLTWPYVLGAISFHLAILATMKINFLNYFGATFLVFLDWPTLLFLTAPLRLFWIHPTVPASSNQTEFPAPITIGDTRAARWMVVGMWGVLMACIVARVESWPFTDYRVFSGRQHASTICVYRLATIDANGQTAWIPSYSLPLSTTTINRRIRTLLSKHDPKSLLQLVDECDSHVAKLQPNGHRRLTVVERTLRYTPGTTTPEIIDRPLDRHSLAAAAREPIEVAGRQQSGLERR